MERKHPKHPKCLRGDPLQQIGMWKERIQQHITVLFTGTLLTLWGQEDP